MVTVTVTQLFQLVTYRNTYFKRRGLPAPPPRSLFLGNIPEIQAELKPCEKFYEWGKIYGKTYGTYEGGHHTIVTSDLDILHDIFVKNLSISMLGR